jgi:MFS family permease
MTHETTALRTALAGFTILVCSMGIGRFAFTPLLPIMQSEGLLSVASGGVLASVHFIGYAMGALLASRLTSSPAVTLTVSMVIIGTSTVAMGTTNIYEVWVFSRWIAGVCSALVLVIVSTHLVKQLAESGRPELQGWVFAGVGGGTAIVGLVVLLLMLAGSPSWLGWQIFGYMTIVAIAAVFALDNTQSSNHVSQKQAHNGTRSSLAWQIVLPYGAMGAGYIIPATYLPIMAREAVSSPLVFGWSWPIFGLAAALSTVLSARLHAAYSNRQIWVVSQCTMALGLVLPALWPHIATVVVGGICVGGTFMVITMAGIKEAHRLVGGASAQQQIAAMTTSFAIGQIIGPALAGWMYQATNNFTYPLLLGAILLIVTLAPMLQDQRDGHPTGGGLP